MKMLLSVVSLVWSCALLAVTDAERQGSGMMNATCPSRAEGGDGGIKVVVLGNSITLHAPAPQIGWTNDWGMAASAREKDYVHLVARAIGEKTGRAVDLRIRNLAAFERNYRTWNAEKELADLVAFCPDYLVVALGENVPNLAKVADVEDFRLAFTRLLAAFRRADGLPHGVVRGVFWRNPLKDEQMHRAAQEVGFPFVRTDFAAEPGMMATGLFAHQGVQNHPGDRGMAETAARIVDALFPSGNTARLPSTVLPAGVNFAGDPVRRNFSLVSDEVEVRVDGRRSDARAIRVSAHPFNRVWPGHQRPYDQSEPSAYVAFEKNGPAAFEVRPKGGCQTAVVRPLAAGVKPTVKDGVVSFVLPTNGYYTVEFDNSHRTLHVFSEPPRDFSEYGRPTRVFGPGAHMAGAIRVQSGDRIYIDRDAVVYGRLIGENVSDVKIFGGGVLDGSVCERVFDSGYTPLQPYGLGVFRSRDITVDGPVLVNCAYWCTAFFDCENVDVSHLKVVGQWRYNTDGIDICNSRHVRVHDCFVRSFDDTICVKGVLPFADRPVEDIVVSRCVLWCGWGNTCEIGVETHAPSMKGIRFENCDLIRNAAIALDVGCGGKTVLDDVTFRDLRVEYPHGAEPMVLQKSEADVWKGGAAGTPQLAVVRATPYGKDGGGGKVGKVVFEQIRVLAEEGVPRPLMRVAAGTDVRLPALDATLRLETTTPVLVDFGPEGTAGYPEIVARPLAGQPKVRLSYGCYPAFGKYGDFWRETSARYLGPTFDLPILPANINRYDVFAVTNAGLYASPLQQGLQRYVRVQLDEPQTAVDITDLRFVNRGTHATEPAVGSFSCSDARLTALWKASVRTCQLAAIPARTEPLNLVTPETNVVLGTTHAYLSDGAKRDRLVWSGDLWWSQVNMYAAYASDSPYLPGSLRMLAENQTPEGYVQACPYPESHGPLVDGDYGPFASDEFAAWFVPVLAAHYLHTGDKALVEELYPNMRRLLAYLARHTRDDFIFEQRPETSKHANGLAFGTSSVHHRSFINVLLWRTFRDAAFLAESLGEAAESSDWKARAERYAAVTREKFVLPSGLLRTSLEDARPGLEATALALGTTFFTPDEAKRALAALPRVEHGKFQMLVVRGAFAYGLPDEALRRIAEHDWLKMVDPAYEGIHTTTECMQFRRKCSWGDEAHPDTAMAGDLTAGVLGIVPLEPGYRRFAFKPGAAESLDWAEGVVPTPYGPIKASWRRVDGKIEKTLTCPDELILESHPQDMAHVFAGRWITDAEFAAQEPRPVYARQLQRDKLPPVNRNLSNRHILFRRAFPLDAAKDVRVFVTADDYYKLYVNGKFAGQGPAAGTPEHTYYNEIDVTPFVTTGRNVIAVHTYYQGLVNRVWMSGDNRHGLLLDLVADGRTVVASDASFLTAPHRAYTSCGIAGYDTQFLERYDAGAPEVGFERPDFDDAGWVPATAHPHGGDYAVFPQPTPMLAFEDVKPVSCATASDGTLRFDFGGIYVGSAVFEAKGPKGAVVKILCGQELNADGSVRHKMRCNCDYSEELVLSGGSCDRVNPFDYKSFRYLELKIPAGASVDPASVVLRARHLPFELKAKPNFGDDPDLLRIWRLGVDTFRYGVQEQIQDCMDREKGYYLGDGCYTMYAYCLLTGDWTSARRFFDDFLRTKVVDRGLVTCGNCSFMQEIAEYPFMFVWFARAYMEETGDVDFLRARFDAFADILDSYRERYARADGLLVNLDKWSVVEWPKNFQDGYDADVREGKVCTDLHNAINAWYIGAVKSLNAIAARMGRPPYADVAPLERSFRKAFWKEDRHLFVDREDSDHVSLPGNSFAAMFGLLPSDESAHRAYLTLVREKAFSSISMFQFVPVFAYLKGTGETELLHDLLVSPDAWLRILREGGTRTFEGWGRDTKWNTSLFHLTAASVVLFLTDSQVETSCKNDIIRN